MAVALFAFAAGTCFRGNGMAVFYELFSLCGNTATLEEPDANFWVGCSDSLCLRPGIIWSKPPVLEALKDSMPRRLLRKMTGNGIVTSPDGETQKVAYKIDVYQDEIRIPTHGGLSSIPGQEDWQGTVRPACFLGANGVVLPLDTGEKIPILVVDQFGRIAHG
jgi:hypothetical protein